MKVIHSLHHIRQVDDLARKDSLIQRLHPLAKLLATLMFLVVVLSYGSTEIAALIPFFLYPVLLLSLSEVPLRTVLFRLLLIEPFVLLIGIFQAFLNQHPIQIGAVTLTAGQITLLSLLIKSTLTISATLLLLMTTSIEKIAYAMQQLKIPRLFILQFLLTYRYSVVLAEELSHMQRSYFLRAPGQKGLPIKLWGIFAGQLLIRTFDRARRIYQAMLLRGYQGDFEMTAIARLKSGDILFICCWLIYFIVMRLLHLPTFLSTVFPL